MYREFLTNQVQQQKMQFTTVILTFLVLLQLFRVTISIPSVRCGDAQVLDFEIEINSLTTTDCSDKHVCELKCSDYIKYRNCDHQTFLDLTNVIKRNQNYQTAYEVGCSFLIDGSNLSDKTSIYFREILGKMTGITQKYYYTKFFSKVFPYTKKYPELYNWTIGRIRKLPEIKGNLRLYSYLIGFENLYVNFVTKMQRNVQLKYTIYGLYDFTLGLASLQRICSKEFKKLKNKSMKNVILLIFKKISQQFRSKRKCRENSFCKSFHYFSSIDEKMKNYFILIRNSIATKYANNLAKSLIDGDKKRSRNYCNCMKIQGLKYYIGKQGYERITKLFPKSFTFEPLGDRMKSICESKCIKKIDKKEDENQEKEEYDDDDDENEED